MSQVRIPLTLKTPVAENKEPKTSKAQLEAVKRYDEKVEYIRLKVSPEIKKAIKSRADSMGKSMTKYLLDFAMDDIVDSALSDSDS